MDELEAAKLCELLNIKYPIIMAPMFLVSNNEMLIEATKAGIAGCIPALNWRSEAELRNGLKELDSECKGAWGINLIVNKSNLKLQYQIKACLETPPDFIITSLGNPKEVIEQAHKKGIKLFCDVTDINYAQKVVDAGADGLIAVNAEAGGHRGSVSYKDLLPQLVKEFDVPVISAGGVGNREGIIEKLKLGASGVSVGSPFIASSESPVSGEYKQACVDYGADDIVVTTKISGSPLTVINTPYVQKIGTKQNKLERMLSKNKRLKKYVKMFVFAKGMRSVEKAAFSASYKTVWCAGPSIEFTSEIKAVDSIVQDLIS